MECNELDVQRILEECRKEMADRVWYVNTLKEENRQLRLMLLSEQAPGVIHEVLTLSGNGAQWRDECMLMQQSVSWRITKPLRLIKKTIQKLHSLGLLATLKHIINKLRK